MLDIWQWDHPSSPLVLVPHHTCFTPSDREKAFHEWVDRGYEGVVLKNPEAHYDESRAWLKVKKENTWDVQVTGFTPGLGKWAGTVGSLQIEVLTPTGILRSIGNVNAGSQRDRDDFLRRLEGKSREEIIRMGLILEVGGQELTQDRMIRFPRIVRERKDRSLPQVL